MHYLKHNNTGASAYIVYISLKKSEKIYKLIE